MAGVRSWTVDDVCRWLISINMSSVSSKLEMGGVDGERLLTLNEASMAQQLKINNPSQRIALMAAINALKGSMPSRSRTMVPTEARSTISSERNRSSSTGQQSRPARKSQPSSTKPSPPLHTVVLGPAPKLLDEYCNHSGWIRKRGGSHKTWKHRYLVLRLGHVYYYENETANKPKGHFSLDGYRVVQCSESDNIKRFPWVFKLLHENPDERTYFISAAAHHEMKKWMDELNTEIRMISQAPNSSSSFPEDGSEGVLVEEDDQHVYDPVAKEDDEEDDNDDDEEDPYDHVTDTDKLYDMVASGEDEDDDSDYERIRDEGGNPLVIAGSAPLIAHPPSPTHSSQTLPTLGHTTVTYNTKVASKTIGGWSLTDHTKPRKGKGDAPTVPPRSLESLGMTQLPPIPFDSGSSHPGTHPSPQPPTAHPHPLLPSHPPPDDDDNSSDDGGTYLRLTGDNAVGSSPPNTPDPEPPTLRNVRSGVDLVVPTLPPKENSRPVVSPVISPAVNQEVEEENPYYITLKPAEEVMPSHCVFGPMNRDEAESRLAKASRLGSYLLRDGTHADAEKVLSVWSGVKAKHYKLYKEEKGYCLTHGEAFPTIPMLLQHYKTNETLPKSDNYLGEPYHPADR